MKKLSLLLCLSTLLSCNLANASLQLNDQGKNKNFLYEYDPKALASTVYFAFRTGSINDPQGKEGLTRLAFESLLRGTKDKSRLEFISSVENLGAGIDVDSGINRTILTLNSINENLQPAIALLAEAVLTPGLREPEINSLRDEELAGLNQQKSNNRSLMKRAFRQALFQGTPLAFPADGTIDGVKNSSLADIGSVLAAAIKSGNVLVAVTTNQKEGEIKNWLEKAFQKLPDGAGPADPKFTLKNPSGRTLYLMDRQGSSTTEVAIGQLGIKANDQDRDALEAGMFIFGADFTSRLSQVLRQKNGWTYGAYSSYQLLDLPRKHGGAFMMYSFPQAEFTEKAAPKLVEMFEDYTKKGISAKELQYAENSLANSYAFRLADSKSKIMGRLYEALDGAPFWSVTEYRKKIRSLTQKKILQAVDRVHDPKNLVLVLVGDPEQTKNISKLIPGIKKIVHITDPMQAL